MPSHTHCSLRPRHNGQHDLWPELTLLRGEYSSVWDLPYTLIFTLASVFFLVSSASRHLTDIPSHPHAHIPIPTPSHSPGSPCPLTRALTWLLVECLFSSWRCGTVLSSGCLSRVDTFPWQTASTLSKETTAEQKAHNRRWDFADWQPQFGPVVLQRLEKATEILGSRN